MVIEKPITKKRKRGIKNPPGVTRALILEYILNNSMVLTDDIRDYLGEKGVKRHIKTKNLIYGHLKMLEGNLDKDGNYRAIPYIKRIPGENNKPDSYIIIDGFETFKNVFNFLKEHHLEKNFMQSSFYKNYIQTEDFLTKIPFNFLRLTILELYDTIKDGDKREQLIEEIEKNKPTLCEYANIPSKNYDAPISIEQLQPDPQRSIPNTTQPEIINTIDITKNIIANINDINKGSSDDPVINAFLSLVKDLQEHTIDEFIEIYKRRFAYPPDQYRGIDVNKNLKYITGYYFVPEGREPDMARILLLSPSAIDFMLNSKFYNNEVIYYILSHYFKQESDLIPNFYIRLFSFNPSLKGLYLEKLLGIPKNNIDFSKILPGIKLFYILRDQALNDLISGNIEKDESTYKTLNQAFLEGKRE
jgi:hypothetical protein